MKTFLLIFSVAFSPLLGTYIFLFEEESLDQHQKMQLFDAALKGEPPRVFYDT